MKGLRLIITADDYGMSPRFNQAVHELARSGVITGASIMVRRPHLNPATIQALPISLGLHLELEPTSPLEEVGSQIARFKHLFGRLPAYLDGHQHQHLVPQHFQAVMLAAQRHHLPVRSRFAEDRAILKSAGIPTPENFISWHPDRIDTLKERMLEARKFSVSELVVHPGYFDPACAYPYNREREQELDFLKGQIFKKLLAPFESISYSQLGKS